MTMTEINAALEAMTRLCRILMGQASTAQTITDTEIVSCKALLPKWEAGIKVEPGECYVYEADGKVYRVREGQGHTTQESWTPDQTPAMWEAIDVEHAGTLEDPIPAVPNMEYFNGKYYSENGAIYKCTRDTEIPIAQMPSALVGVYFELVG